MHVRKCYRGAVGLALVLSCVSLCARAEKTLWLVRPLYPGQETLVERTEKALDKLMPGPARNDAIIGKKELALVLKGQSMNSVPCFSADERCLDPIDPFMANFGFERVVLIQGGQDEAGFKYRVSAYEPRTGKVSPAAGANANLEKALLGAIAKVVPAASTLEVKSEPSGATVYIDDVKVGVTPLNTQVLPGERVIRVDLKLHQPLEETIVIPIRGTASMTKALEKVAARIVITASPPGAEIAIDGVLLGKDKVDRGIIPGSHTIRLSAENHKAFEQTISVKADEQYSLDKTLEPLPGAEEWTGEGVDRGDQVARVSRVPPPRPRPATIEDMIYERHSYFHLSFELATLLGDSLVGRRFDTAGFGRTTTFNSSGRTLIGVSVEYGTYGKYFGMSVFGVSYLANVDPWQMNVGFTPKETREASGATLGPAQVDPVHAHLVVIRALQPQVRFVVWRFQLALQLGLEFRTGQISGQDPGADTTFYKDGFVPLDLLLAGRLNVRYFVVDGLFIHLQGNYTQYLLGERATDEQGGDYGSSSSVGFNGGVGYGF